MLPLESAGSSIVSSCSGGTSEYVGIYSSLLHFKFNSTYPLLWWSNLCFWFIGLVLILISSWSTPAWQCSTFWVCIVAFVPTGRFRSSSCNQIPFKQMYADWEGMVKHVVTYSHSYIVLQEDYCASFVQPHFHRGCSGTPSRLSCQDAAILINRNNQYDELEIPDLGRQLCVWVDYFTCPCPSKVSLQSRLPTS